MTMTLDELMADYRAATLPSTQKAREKRVDSLKHAQNGMPKALDNLRNAQAPGHWGGDFFYCIFLLLITEPSRTRRRPKYVDLRKEWGAIVLQAAYGEAGPHALSIAVSLGLIPADWSSWERLHFNKTTVDMLYATLHGKALDTAPVQPEDLDGLGL